MSSSGFGQAGPYSKNRVYDPIIQVLTGICEPMGDQRGPCLMNNQFVDKLSALTFGQAACAALLARERGKGGQHVLNVMQDASLSVLWGDVYQDYVWTTGVVGAAGKRAPPILEQLRRQGLAPAGGPLKSRDEAFAEPRLRAWQLDTLHPFAGRHVCPRWPVIFEGTPLAPRPPCPWKGEHTVQILKEQGFGADEIRQMLQSDAATSGRSLAEKEGESPERVLALDLLERLQSGPQVWGKGKQRRSGAGQTTLDSPGGTAAAPTATGPLAGLRVLDASSMVAGPMAAMMLGDQGAEVWKLERPTRRGGEDLDGLDPSRRLGPAPRAEVEATMGALFFTLNRNKRSLLLDTHTPEGKKVLEQLLQNVDVVIADDSGPEDADAAVIPVDLAQRANPKLLFVLMDRRLGEFEAQAVSGSCALQYDEQGGRRQLCTMLCEKAASFYLATSVCAALWAQQARKEEAAGQVLRADLLGTSFHYNCPDIFLSRLWENWDANDSFPDVDRVYSPFLETKDKTLIWLICVSDKEWRDYEV